MDEPFLHYHVCQGTTGCLPDAEPETFLDRIDADAFFDEEVDAWKDAGYAVDEPEIVTHPFHPRNQDEVLRLVSIDPINYLELVRCGAWDRCELYQDWAERTNDDLPGPVPGEPA